MSHSLLRQVCAAAAVTASALFVAPAQAATFTDIVIFGDSLSDTGNLSLATGGAQPPTGQPYFNGRFSDGLVWTDYFTAALGHDATPSILGGSNYAFAGARTGTSSSPPGTLAQVGGLWNKPAADPNALYVLVGGGNDMRDARSSFSGDTDADRASRQAAAAAAIANLNNTMGLLVSKGARHILISTLPDLGRTPEAVGLGLVAASSDVTARFNALIPGLESFYDGLGIDIDVLDMAGAANAVYLDATTNSGGVYGMTNAFAPCNGFLGSPNVGATACNLSLFSDGLHPSTAAHAVIAEAALTAVSDVPAVPEPETYALMLFGLGAVGWAARRRAAGGSC